VSFFIAAFQSKIKIKSSLRVQQKQEYVVQQDVLLLLVVLNMESFVQMHHLLQALIVQCMEKQQNVAL